MNQTSKETTHAISRSYITNNKNNWNERPYMALQYMTDENETGINLSRMTHTDRDADDSILTLP